MTIYKCDRCGKHFEERPLNIEINDRRAIYPRTIKSFDLCDECFKSFDEWLGVPYDVSDFPDNCSAVRSFVKEHVNHVRGLETCERESEE